MKKILGLLLVIFVPITGFTCLSDGGTLKESLNCTGMPTILKFFDPIVMTWQGKEFVFLNDGNNLRTWDISIPESPVTSNYSRFGVDNQGDSDYDLLNYSVCEDCRYGVAVFKLGIVVWDLGTGTKPGFVAKKFYSTGSSDPRGAFVYKYQNNVYLVAKHLPNDCGKEGTVYLVNGISSLNKVGCVDIPGTAKILNGFQLGNNQLYLGFTDNYIYYYDIDEVPMNIMPTGIRASLVRGKGLALDLTSKIAVATFPNQGMKIYDIATPQTPVLLSTTAGNWGLTAVSYPFVHVDQPMAGDLSKTFLISDPKSPQPLNWEFWDASNPWNQHIDPQYGDCEMGAGSVFSTTGHQLFYARYSVFQRISFTGCVPSNIIFQDGFESGNTSAWQ